MKGLNFCLCGTKEELQKQPTFYDEEEIKTKLYSFCDSGLERRKPKIRSWCVVDHKKASGMFFSFPLIRSFHT